MAETDLVEGGALAFRGDLSPISYQCTSGTTYDDWARDGALIQSIAGASTWWVGDWLNAGEQRWGETYTQAVEQTGLSVKTLSNAQWVANSIPPAERRRDLTFSHHSETAQMSSEDRASWLDRAATEQWTQRELRRQIRLERVAQLRAARAARTPLETMGRYPVIYADPPWQYSNRNFEGTARSHYETMSETELEGLPLKEVADEEGAVLFMWATNPQLDVAVRLMEYWGFQYKTNFTWVKQAPMFGALAFYNRGQHEMLLLGTKGSYTPIIGGDDLPVSVIVAPRTEHSSKPDQAYEIIEQLYPHGPYLELFSRGNRDGWTVWGDEAAPADE